MCGQYDACMAVQPPPIPDLASQVARLFFDRQMTKVEIAAHLGISRFRVARLIDGALADGLVRIEYRDLPAEDRDLATGLEERHGLDLCAVADVGDGDPVTPTARLAGALLDSLIGPADVVGVAWGSTLAAVVVEIPRRTASAGEVVQLAGSSTRLARGRDPGELARTLADRLAATCRAIYAPAFVGSSAMRRELLRQPEVAGAADRFPAVTLAIVGIGAFPADQATGHGATSSLVRSGVLDDTEVARLVARGAVGDLVVHPFDAEGRFVAPELAERAVAIGVEDLRAVPRVVAVAAGAGKAAAIRGALATGVIDVLVIDAPTARAVLALDR
jgi:DNA-binding transcriptional regulator LsrR (DeoR family)